MRIMQYVVTYKYNADDPQEEEIFYTPEAARAKVASVQLWGGIAVITETDVEEGELNGIH